MSNIFEKFLDLMDLEKLEENLFRGVSLDIGSRSVFGGQVLAQALIAASRTVEGDRIAHSLHAYFLRPGDVNAPIVFQVERMRDGRSFSTRRIVAIQHGRPIFNMAASFQMEEEGFDHQADMPQVPIPEELWSLLDFRNRQAEKYPEKYKNRPYRQIPIEIKPVVPADPYSREPSEPVQKLWFRTSGHLPDDVIMHQAAIAYASDFNLLRTAILPYQISLRNNPVDMASIDHAMWFHRDLRADDWLLYDMESPSVSGARGFADGRIYSRDGRLVASVAQEGMIRRRVPRHKEKAE